MLYTLADLVYIYHDQNLKPIPSPAPSDAFFLSCNVAFIVGFAILTQSSFGRVHASVRLDGAIAGLAIAAVAGIIWFEPVLAPERPALSGGGGPGLPGVRPRADRAPGGRPGPPPLPAQLDHRPAHDRRRVVRGRQRDLSQPESPPAPT